MSWGILMGAGRGISRGAETYGKMMESKRKEDFQLKRDELQFERQTSLEELKNKHASARQESSQEHAEGLQGRREDMTREGWERQDAAKVVGIGPGGMEISQEEYDKMTPEEQNQVLGKEDYKMKIKQANQDMDLKTKIEHAKMLDKWQNEKDEKKRQTNAENYKDVVTNGGKEEMDPIEELNYRSLNDGQDYLKMINRGKAPSAEQMKQVLEYLSTDEKYHKLEGEERMAYTLEVSKRLFAKQGGDALPGEGGDGGGDDAQVDVEGIGAKIGAAGSKEQRDQMLDDVKERYGEEVYNQVAAISHNISGDNVQNPAPSGSAIDNTAKPKIARPTAELMYQMKKEHPGMSDKWYRSQFQSWYQEKDREDI